jgi:hypothetical protein
MKVWLDRHGNAYPYNRDGSPPWRHHAAVEHYLEYYKDTRHAVCKILADLPPYIGRPIINAWTSDPGKIIWEYGLGRSMSRRDTDEYLIVISDAFNIHKSLHDLLLTFPGMGPKRANRLLITSTNTPRYWSNAVGLIRDHPEVMYERKLLTQYLQSTPYRAFPIPVLRELRQWIVAGMPRR